MPKDYTKWHEVKSAIEEHRNPPFFNEREVWWSSLGANIGTEQDGKNARFERPVIIVRKFNKDLFWGVPATLQSKDDAFHFGFMLSGIEQRAIVSQIRTLSAKRLIRRIGKLPEPKFAGLKEAIESLMRR
ncbi:MAG: type II toxin-antitoxin system PemK/MazF family toxin [bacterium]